MTIQEQIMAMKIKLSEMINQKNQLGIDIKSIMRTIDKLETLAESEDNPSLADDLVKEFSK